MIHTIVLAAGILIPAAVLILFRIDAALVFLSLCLGYVMVQFVSGDAVSLLTSAYANAGSLSTSTIKVIFLLLPAVLTMITMFKSVKGSHVFFNTLPALGVGLLLVLLLEPLLSLSMQATLSSSSLWVHLQQAQTLAVGAGAIVSLIFLWTLRGQVHGDRKHHSKS